ncbi:hypothetical protein [Rhodococcus sp. NPDC057529]|uniref:hypothetical protein n=1 Tax=Rhodococcus sp. NPDC057529 TaxID=3346158 RepID=UPI00366CAB3D
MSDAYDEQALWMKAKLFLSHAMDDDEPRDFDERGLWASLALELLAKAALARVSPVLIASPSEDGTNLLIASGLVDGDARFTSVAAHTLMSRSSKAFRPFDEKEAGAIMRARNNYLHGGAAAFTKIPADAWWPRFWAQAIILVHAQDKDLEDLVGLDRVSVVENHLTQNKKNIEHRVEMLISRAKQRLAQYQSGNLSSKVAAEWTKPVHLTAGLSHSGEGTCPACGDTGTLEGEDVLTTETKYEQLSEEDYDVWVDLTISADYFSCPTCRLILDSWELISAAGLEDEFSGTGDYGDYMEPEYGND